jgi:isopenicillin-N epimerase
VVTARLPFPGTTPDAAVAAVLEAVTPRTRLAMVDHVTSPTALVLPIAEIVARLDERGIDVLVDGAHGPGMVDVDVSAIGATYYAANCHKWLCAPKGSAFLHVRRDRQDRIRPLAFSHGANSPRTDRSRFRLEHDWIGTLDPSPWLAVPAAIEFGAGLLPGGWTALRDRGHALALEGRDLVCRALGQPAPVADSMIGAMASIPLPGSEVGPRPLGLYDDPVHERLMRAGIQVAIGAWSQQPDGRPWQRLLRLSAAPYVGSDDMERLAGALEALHAPA